MNKNLESTRFYSDAHEKSVCKALGAQQTANSGANRFQKGDCIVPEASMLIECKCAMEEKKSVSVKREWFQKNKEEAFMNRLDNQCVCINFGPNTENIYCINEKLMKYLVERLSEED